jgi:6,7-dimethyl-8-ribityllumazine synthase
MTNFLFGTISMAGGLPKKAGDFYKIPHARIAIIGSMWHAECVEGMMRRAHTELLACDVASEQIQIHRIPGSLELPFAARVLFEHDSRLDAILAFGVVLQGATAHNESVLANVVHGFSLVSERYCKPIINEVIGVSSISDAEARSSDDDKNKGLEAVFAVTEILHWKKSLENKVSD